MAKRQKKRKQYAKIKTSKGTVARRGVLVFFGFFLSVIVLFGAYLLLSYAGSLFFSRNPHFELKHVIMSSDGRLTPSQLMEYGGVERGVNLFSIDLDPLRKNLEGVALIESVHIQRRLPDTLIVRVSERVAVAQVSWKWRAPCFLIDHEGVVLPPTRAGQALPMIEGLKLDQLRPGEMLSDSGVQYVLELLDASRSMGPSSIEFERFDLRYPDYINAVLADGVSARFPRHSADNRIVRLAATLQMARERGQRIKTADLTPDGRNVPVTYY
jgi:cell division septal protein FtsQ